MTTFNFTNLQREIEAASKLAFEELLSLSPAEDFCAFALYSDSDALTVCPSVNTIDHLREVQSGDLGDEAYH